jgi:hypothetical protein
MYASTLPPLKKRSNASAVMAPSGPLAPASQTLPFASGTMADAPAWPRNVE